MNNPADNKNCSKCEVGTIYNVNEYLKYGVSTYNFCGCEKGITAQEICLERKISIKEFKEFCERIQTEKKFAKVHKRIEGFIEKYA